MHGAEIAAAAAVALLALGGAMTAKPSADDWMFPGRGASPAGAASDPGETHKLAGSDRSFTTAQLRDLYAAVDWFPDRHPTPPLVVLHGHPTGVMACGFCHLPDGEGRPENAALAGLPAAYIAAQMADMASHARGETRPDWTPGATMQTVAAAASKAEVAQAAAYFSALPFTSHERVVEAAQIPAVRPAAFLYRTLPGEPREPLGERIVEVPDDFERFELRAPDVRYTAYVPPGAVARGKALARTGGFGVTQPCVTCHGPALRGALGPPIAGRYPTYLFRQLHAFHAGARNGAGGAPMTAVAARLTDRDMIDLAAYVGSLKP